MVFRLNPRVNDPSNHAFLLSMHTLRQAGSPYHGLVLERDANSVISPHQTKHKSCPRKLMTRKTQEFHHSARAEPLNPPVEATLNRQLYAKNSSGSKDLSTPSTHIPRPFPGLCQAGAGPGHTGCASQKGVVKHAGQLLQAQTTLERPSREVPQKNKRQTGSGA